MKHFILGALILSQLISCKTEDSPMSASQNIDALQTQFQGKYRIVSAVSSEPLDVNLDGLLSTNLLTEIDELLTGTITDPYATIRISGPSNVNPKPSFSFSQAWPEQYVRMSSSKAWDGIEMIPFNSAYSTSYDMKVVFRELTFSEDLKRVSVTPNESEEPYLLQSLPKSLSVESDGKISVLATRRIYTSLGVKEVSVVTTYERYTTKK